MGNTFDAKSFWVPVDYDPEGNLKLPANAENLPAGVKPRELRIPVCDFTYSMEWMGYTVNDPEYWNYSFCVVKGDDGKWHGFGERARESEIPMKGTVHCLLTAHVTMAEIAHYISDQPEGPYTFVDVALPRGEAGTLEQTRIFPCVMRDGNRWIMVFTGLSGDVARHDQRAFLAVSDSLYGPWKKVGIVIEPSSDPKNWTYGSYIKLPYLVEFRGKWFAYFKSGTVPHHDYVAVATADRPEGPWTISDRPAIQKSDGHPGTYIEDLCSFVWNDRVYIMITDNLGRISGVPSGILLFESEDGLTFPFEKVRLAVDQIPFYCPGFDPGKAVTIWPNPDSWSFGYRFTFEAPRILLIDGIPKYFFAGSGTNVDGVPKSGSYCLKIPNWSL